MSRKIPTLTALESNSLLDALLVDTGTKRQKEQGLRNYAIGLLMLDAGLRVAEVTGLLMTDLMFKTEPVHALNISAQLSHGKEDRLIPLTQRTRRAIESLFLTDPYRSHLEINLWAFPAKNRNLHITTRQVERIIEVAGRKAIGRKVHPHLLRHTFASKLMRTTNARIVQSLLGHRDLRSTQVYTHPNSDDLKAAIESTEKVLVTSDGPVKIL